MSNLPSGYIEDQPIETSYEQGYKDATTKWHKITEGEGDESYPYGYALIAVESKYPKNIEIHIGCYYRQYEEEASEICVDNDFTDYKEADDTYYTPKGWYQETAIEEYSGIHIEGVVAWAELPKYEVDL